MKLTLDKNMDCKAFHPKSTYKRFKYANLKLQFVPQVVPPRIMCKKLSTFQYVLKRLKIN